MLNLNQLIEYFESILISNCNFYQNTSDNKYPSTKKFNKYQVAYFNNLKTSHPNLEIEKTFL